MLGVELEGVGKDCDLNRGVKGKRRIENENRMLCAGSRGMWFLDSSCVVVYRLLNAGGTKGRGG